MKQEWLKRTIDSWENIKTQYSEKDFSQANLLKAFISLKKSSLMIGISSSSICNATSNFSEDISSFQRNGKK